MTEKKIAVETQPDMLKVLEAEIGRLQREERKYYEREIEIRETEIFNLRRQKTELEKENFRLKEKEELWEKNIELWQKLYMRHPESIRHLKMMAGENGFMVDDELISKAVDVFAKSMLIVSESDSEDEKE